jgi:hypothetical protein
MTRDQICDPIMAEATTAGGMLEIHGQATSPPLPWISIYLYTPCPF